MAQKPVKRAVRSLQGIRIWPFYRNRAIFQSPVQKKAAEKKNLAALDKIIEDLESDDEPKKSVRKKK